MKKYLGISDIAEITGKERSTIFRWIKSGKFEKVRKIGNEYQVPHDSFERWWSQNVKIIQAEEGNE